MMRCPICRKDTNVTDSRPIGDGRVRRRRRLCALGHRFTTYERISDVLTIAAIWTVLTAAWWAGSTGL
jgi:transcriptional regulator NrdR family protein